ncbi:MAG TPA: hypothetical protein VFA78_07495 [Chloroflexota bacterium]|nr:hypothetical protein [Chloroflexota bacterium]
MKKPYLRTLLVVTGLLGFAVPSARALAAPAAATYSNAGSIVYQSGANIWLAAPNGSGKRQITRDGTKASPYQYPTRALNGTIETIRNLTTLYHLNPYGKVIGRLLKVATGPSNNIPLHTMAMDAAISPNGQRVAVTTVEYEGIFDPSTGAHGANIISEDIYYYATSTGKTILRAHEAGSDLMSPAWVNNNQVLFFAPYNIAADQVYLGQFHPLGWPWFADGDFFSRQPLNHGDLTTQKDKLAVVRGNDLVNDWRSTTIQIYRTNGNLHAAPTAVCAIKAQHGAIGKVTWSPDGSTLAWSDSNGIWESPVNLSAANCGLAPKLVIKGGTNPDWSPVR